MENPLLKPTDLPPFSQIKAEHVEPAINTLLKENRTAIDRLTAQISHPTWTNFIDRLEQLQNKLERAWSPVRHMNSVVNSDALRQAYNVCIPLLSEYDTEMGQNKALFSAFQKIAQSDKFQTLSVAQKKTIENALRDFRLSGIDLSEVKQQRYKKVAQRLSELSSKFSDNVLDATNAWKKTFDNTDDLRGLPDSAIAMAKQSAEQVGNKGWQINLEYPSYFAVITYAENRDLREEVYRAYVTRASDQGPFGGQWDNTPVIAQILALRHEKTQLLGFDNYAQYSLTTKMADKVDQVTQFLNDLAEKSLPIARRELAELQQYATANLNLDTLNAWDIAFASEKLRQHRYDITQEQLKPYFPEPQVLVGMFNLVERLFGLSIKEKSGIDVWHKHVRFFEIFDSDNELRGQFYIDLFARSQKQGGAWMDEYATRMKLPTGIQTPVAYITCNFSPPIGDDPALLTHNEVLTLFHEFGHSLQHMLTKIDVSSVSGINGVPWDAVELPSQFMENWCWQKEVLDLFAKHYQTGEPLPKVLFEKMIAAKNFHAGMAMVRQIEFALFDIRLHAEYQPEKENQMEALLDEVREQVAVIKPPAFNRFVHSFSHILAGGYAAGYYSYTWAEVLSADAFSMFEEKGIFDPDTGKRFLNTILEQGGSQDPMDLFKAFRGREPNTEALLRHSGIT